MGGGVDAGLHMDRAAVLLNEAARDPQSEPGADVLLGCEEGVEDAASDRSGNANTTVSDRQAGPFDLDLEVTRPAQLQRQLAVWGQSVDGVRYQIGNNLPQLSGRGRQENV